MEPNHTACNARRQRTPEEIIKLLDDYDKSEDISVREYCDMIGISDATFYNWQKKYRDNREADFVPLEISPAIGASDGLQVEIRIIKFYGQLSPEQFNTLLS